MNNTDLPFMMMALKQAQLGALKNEVPVGAVLVKEGRIIAQGHNLTRARHDPTAHAEIVVIRKALKVLQNERFLDTKLYVTLEPCSMCAGAIIQARISEVMFGAYDPKAGACGSVLKVIPNKNLNHCPRVLKGFMEEECAEILRAFFRVRR
ncbi:MAG: tRNA adenosine(34) deaminase TadA [Elusimicrobiota bacterium]